MKLELNDHEPIFIQISKAIEDEILSDSIKEGDASSVYYRVIKIL